MNTGEFLEMDPYEEVAQQGQVHPLSPAYVTDLMEPEHPEYHAPSDDDIQVEDDDEDLEEDPSEKHEPEDDDEDPNEEHEPEDEDTREPSEDSDETELLKEDETVVTPPSPIHCGARISAPLGHRAAMIHMRDDIPEEDMLPRRIFRLTAPPPGYDIAESFAAAARAPRSQYDFVDTDVDHVRALHASEQRMMTSIEEVNLKISYQAQIRRQEMRGQRTAYKTELHEVHQAYLSSEARNRALLARLKTLETHVSRMEWQHQSAEDLVVT
uniref:Uncharacterized protein n=1 Tax=Tanacetum cinerariifolium TaxID=118510 RepID=A0A699GUQ8_TANCI|nr:hypothetical protein [Tanacetum cinerariifolium]